MTQFLPPNLLALFASRDPIPYKPPAVRLTWEKDHEKNPYTGVSSIVNLFEDPADTPAPTRGETKLEKKFRRIKEKTIIRANEIEEELKSWDPHNDKNATSDSFKTLFVSRINYDTSESKLRREFETYGRIRKINMVKDLQGKPRGYAFIEFEHERDMHSAYKNADGKKIDGRRVLVDVERGRTVKGWRPRRLGGGLGATRRGANEESLNESRRSEPTGNERLDEKKRDTHRSVSKESREKRTSRDRDRERHDRTDRNDRTDRSDRNRSDRKRDRDRREDRPKDRSKERDKDRSRNKERDRDRKRHRDKSKDRDRDGSRRKRSKERDRDRKGSERSSKKESDDKVRAEIKKEPKNGESQENNGMEEEDNQPAKTERKDDNVKIEQEIEEMNESQS